MDPENLDGQVCLREPVVKTMLDPRFEQADRRIRAKMLFEKTTLIKPDGRCFEELKREVIEEGRKIIEMEMNLLNMKRLKISEAVGQIMTFCIDNEQEDPLINRSRNSSNPWMTRRERFSEYLQALMMCKSQPEDAEGKIEKRANLKLLSEAVGVEGLTIHDFIMDHKMFMDPKFIFK